jgi:hypothetical protein
MTAPTPNTLWMSVEITVASGSISSGKTTPFTSAEFLRTMFTPLLNDWE